MTVPQTSEARTDRAADPGKPPGRKGSKPFAIVEFRTSELLLSRPGGPWALALLVNLYRYTDPRGVAYVSRDTLAELLHTSKKTVQRAMNLLIELGEVEILSKPHSSGKATVYLIRSRAGDLTEKPEMRDASEPVENGPFDAPEDETRDTGVHQLGTPVSTLPDLRIPESLFHLSHNSEGNEAMKKNEQKYKELTGEEIPADPASMSQKQAEQLLEKLGADPETAFEGPFAKFLEALISKGAQPVAQGEIVPPVTHEAPSVEQVVEAIVNHRMERVDHSTLKQPERYRETVRDDVLTKRAEIVRLLDEYPSAPLSVIASAAEGETRSLAQYARPLRDHEYVQKYGLDPATGLEGRVVTSVDSELQRYASQLLPDNFQPDPSQPFEFELFEALGVRFHFDRVTMGGTALVARSAADCHLTHGTAMGRFHDGKVVGKYFSSWGPLGSDGAGPVDAVPVSDLEGKLGRSKKQEG